MGASEGIRQPWDQSGYAAAVVTNGSGQGSIDPTDSSEDIHEALDPLTLTISVGTHTASAFLPMDPIVGMFQCTHESCNESKNGWRR